MGEFLRYYKKYYKINYNDFIISVLYNYQTSLGMEKYTRDIVI